MTLLGMKDNPVTVILAILTRYLVVYLALNVLIWFIVIAFVYLLIIMVNFNGGDLRAIGVDKVFYLLNLLGTPAGDSIEANDLLLAYLKLSFVVVFVVAFFKLLVPPLRKVKSLGRYTKFSVGFGFITVMMLIAQASAYLPSAAGSGAKGLWWVLLLMWILSLGIYAMHSMLMHMAELLNR